MSTLQLHFSFADHIHEIPKSEIILGQHLGSGCSGHVYAGAYNGQPVAIKQFICKNESNLPSILHELEILALMDHPNVLALYGYVLDKHDIWVITELAKCDLLQLLGPSTSDGLKETTLPYKTRKAYIRQIANGLLYTITHGIIHQDLKLDNLLLAQNGQIKIADFGLSQLTKKSTGALRSIVSTRRFLDPLFRARQLSPVGLVSHSNVKQVA